MCNGILRLSREWSSTVTSRGFGRSSLETASGSYFDSAFAIDCETKTAANSAITANPLHDPDMIIPSGSRSPSAFDLQPVQSLRVPGRFATGRNQSPRQFVDYDADQNHAADDRELDVLVLRVDQVNRVTK